MRIIIIFWFCFAHVVSLKAQIQDTDIFLYEIDWDKKDLKKKKNLTSWKGYDNQPFFSSDGERLYFTRAFSDQSDVYYYDIRLKVIREFTVTKESEYSPNVTPDGKYISVIRVEKDSAQRLWKFPISVGEPELLFEQLKPVGYQTWVNDQTVAMFILGSPNSLHLGNTLHGSSKPITYDIGRSLHHYNGSVYFVHKESATSWMIKKLDVASEQITTIAETLAGREDFTVTKSGRILMGNGEDIYELKSLKWKRIFKLKDQGFKDFNRLAISDDESKLALVVVMD